MSRGKAERFVARPSRSRLALMLLGALLFIPAGLWVAGALGEPPRPGREWAGWLGGAAFTVAALFALARLGDRSDQIVIDGAGLTWRSWSDAHIPWAAIRSVEEQRMGRQIMFAVHLEDPAAYPPTRLLGRIAGAQSGMGRGNFWIVASGTDRSAEEVRDALDRFGHGSGR